MGIIYNLVEEKSRSESEIEESERNSKIINYEEIKRIQNKYKNMERINRTIIHNNESSIYSRDGILGKVKIK